ncbi:MAG: arylsulfotransferase family protein, partial [Solirubrobacteraceae bacterium]
AGPASGLTFFPPPGSSVASPQTQILIRGPGAGAVRDVVVTGARSGHHAGRLAKLPFGLGVAFVPATGFDPGENVSVSLRDGREARMHFTVARPAPLPIRAGPPGRPTRAGQVLSFHSAPDLHPPVVTVTERSTLTAPGEIFLGPANKLGQAGPLIVDGDGSPVWFHPLPGRNQAFDFTEQRYGGRPVLTWWQGIVTTNGFGVGEDVIDNQAYRRIAVVRAADGYSADLHDFVLTPQGAALLVAFNPVHMDLSSVGGPRDGIVIDCVVQEIDVATGQLLFEWHSLGHVALDESYAKPNADGVFDYFHVNSVALDGPDNLLISARNTWTVYDVSLRTGRIVWRLGGKQSSFTMGPGTGFAYQHDARPQPNGTITLFDNGAEPKVHRQSRALEIRLDKRTMTATFAHQWTHPSPLLAGSQGDVQTLSNGDRFVGWGAQPNMTEFSSNGSVLFDAAIAAPDTSYRAFRFPWTGTPPGRPAIATASEPHDRLIVYASWNGATRVSQWRILAGARPSRLAPLADVPRTGFETAATVFTRDRYVAAQA